MRATIKQIAQQAGVSIGTVDRVLHARGRVNAETAALVQSVAARLGYETNSIAKALSCQRNPLRIAVVLNAPQTNYFAANVDAGVRDAQREIADFGVEVLYREMTAFTFEEQDAILQSLEGQRLNGLVIKPVNDPRIARRIDALCANGVAVVTCLSDIAGSKRLCFVGHNQYREGRMAGSLMSKFMGGRGSVAILTGTNAVLGQYLKAEGFKDYLCEKCPDIHLLGSFEVNRMPALAESILRSVMATSELDGLFIQSMDKQGIETVASILRAGAGRPVVCTFGTAEEFAPLIADGSITFAFEENPYKQGYVAMKTLFGVLFYKKPMENEQIDISPHLLIDEWM